ncbi:MAG: hypothetical protein ACR2L2_07735 [Acidobacteriota bacterium]
MKISKNKPIRILLWIAFFTSPVSLAAVGERNVMVIPQVVVGVSESLCYESLVIVSNPGVISTEVAVFSYGSTGGVIFPSVTLQLAPMETRTIRVQDAAGLRVGWVWLSSVNVFTAAVHILSRPCANVQEAPTQVSILAQPRVSKAVIPVFRRLSALESGIPENTGIAIANGQGADLDCRLVLRNAAGTIVAEKTVAIAFLRQVAKYVTEFFPELPANFASGSLTIEYPDIPYSFAVTALYTDGSRMWSAPVANLDTPNVYFIKLKSSSSIGQIGNELASQYGLYLFTGLPPR